MINKVVCLFMVVLTINCGGRPKPTQNLVGEYKDKDMGVIKMIYLRYVCNELMTVGNSLTLRADSTYTYTSCNMVINGIWSIKSDSLDLVCSDVRWRNDSMNLNNPVKCEVSKSKIYITDEGELKDSWKTTFNNKLMQTNTWLSKVE